MMTRIATAIAALLIFLLPGSSVNLRSAAKLCQGAKERTSAAITEKRDGQEETKLLEEKAVWTLRNIIAQANSPEILQEEASVISSAAQLLWGRDEKYARDSFNRTITILLQEYEVEASKPRRTKLKKLSAAISTLVRALARRDSKLALSKLEEYQKARAKALDSTASRQTPKEKLEIIRAGLDLDPKESASLAANILKFGIPTSFPQYLYDLAGRDSRAADDLYQVALTLIASGVPYSSTEVNLLSAYAFRESAIILPAVGPSGENEKKLSIGIFTTPLSLSGDKAQIDLRIARDYLRVMYPYLSRTRIATFSEAASMAQTLFLVHKLTGYVIRLKLDDPARWQEIDTNFEVMARSNGLDDSNLKYLAGYAERIANDQVAFLFDNGASLFRKANDTTDAKQRTDLLVRGIKELVESKSFSEAEKRIGDVDDQSIRRLLADYLNFKAGEAAAASRDWQEMLSHSGRISDSKLRSLLLLQSARLVKNNGKSKRNKQLISDWLGRAVEDLSKIAQEADRAEGLLAAASFMAAIDPDRSLLILNEAIAAINKAKDYEGGNYRARLLISSVHLDFVLNESDLESTFEQIAKVDWLGVMALIDRLESKSLRNKAQLGACRTILA